MKTIRVYGDSFAAPNPDFDCWPAILGKKINLPVANKAVPGSSTEYAIKCFIQDIQNNIIQDNDIVIFVTSTPGRLHFNFQNTERPDTGSSYLHEPTTNNRHKYEPWYFKNKDHINWWIVNQDHRLNEINHEAYIHLIKDFAWTKPLATFIVLGNTDHRVSIPGGQNPKNFLQSFTYLNRISENEYSTGGSYLEWVKHTNWDLRINHLSIPNLHILAELVEESITNLTVDNITYDKFLTKLMDPISTKAQYADYLANGYLYDMYSLDWFAERGPLLT